MANILFPDVDSVPPWYEYIAVTSTDPYPLDSRPGHFDFGCMQ